MRKYLLACALSVLAFTYPGCVSAWMASSTGKRIEIPEGLARDEVLKLLGQPKERIAEISPATRLHFSHIRRGITFAETFEYKGKINSYDEGGGQATVNALTLGVGEIIMIPMTAADIAKRSIETNQIYVFFDSAEKVVGFMVNPSSKYLPNQSPDRTPPSGVGQL